MAELSDRDHAELLMLYQVTIEDIERAKQWGWTVAYGTMAAQGAVLGLSAAYEPAIACLWVKMFFLVLTIGLGVVGINHIRHAQSSLGDFRERIDRVRNELSQLFKRVIGDHKPKNMWPLEGAVWITTAIVCLLLIAGA